MKIGIGAAAIVAMAVPGMGQTTGVSHPENVPLTTTTDEIRQTTVYAAPAYAAPVTAKPSAALKVRGTEGGSARVFVSAETEPRRSALNPDGAVVGDYLGPHGAVDLDANVVTRVAGPANELPVGTLLKAKIGQTFTTRETVEGTTFTSELTDAALRDGRVLLPAGSVLSGRVTDVHGGRRITGGASIHLQPTAVTLPDGTRYTIFAQVIDTGLYKRMKVDSEGTILRRDPEMAAASVLGLSTGSGAAAGAVFGGWPGAIIGGAVGAGIGTAIWMKKDRQEELPAGTTLVFSLTSPLAVGIESSFSGKD